MRSAPFSTGPMALWRPFANGAPIASGGRANSATAGGVGQVGRVEPLETRALLSVVPWATLTAVPPPDSISGVVFADDDGDGVRGTDEARLAGRQVYLDDNRNGQPDAAERSYQTDRFGRFRFAGLSAGTYDVRTILPGDWKPTSTGDGPLVVDLSAGETVRNQLFGQVRVSPSSAGFGGDARHTAVSPYTSQPLDAIRWQTPVDRSPMLTNGDLLLHYAPPVITGNNTVIVPVKTTDEGSFEVEGRNGRTGALKWNQSSDYLLPPHHFVPTFGPTLTPTGRLYMPGAGGTVLYRDNPDGIGPATTGRIAFYGLSHYQSDPAAYKASVYVDTPITSDAAGNIYFGVQVVGDNPQHVQGGIARIGADGSATFVSAADASGDPAIDKVGHDCAPALSNDGTLVYVAVNVTGNTTAVNYLVALDAATLQPVARTPLRDPLTGENAQVRDEATASPTVGPDGDVYFGVIENPRNSNRGRGWLLHFNRDLAQVKTPGAFGWDDTASVVPASMVPSYTGSSAYLVLTKYNDYAEYGGTGINRLAILDPNDVQADVVTGITAMREVLTIAGPTPDADEIGEHPNAVKEWCINTSAVDPATFSVLANNEDGRLYRWDLRTNTFTQQIELTGGIGEGYTPTLVGPDGTVYAINKATLFAVGS